MKKNDSSPIVFQLSEMQKMYAFIVECGNNPPKEGAPIPTFSDLQDYIHYAMTNMADGYSSVILMDGEKVIKIMEPKQA